jgi:hypothetical protein
VVVVLGVKIQADDYSQDARERIGDSLSRGWGSLEVVLTRCSGCGGEGVEGSSGGGKW